MRIRRIAAAAMIATGAGLLATGVAGADEAQDAANVPAGGTVCVELPSGWEPVHAEGLAERGVRFTLSVRPDGSAGSVLAAHSADDTVDWRADANAYLNPDAFPGAPWLCAENLGDQATFVVLTLTAPRTAASMSAPVVQADAPDNGPVVAEGNDAIDLPAPDPASEAPPTIEDIVAALQTAIQNYVAEIIAEISA